jgi:hypothetical protein
LISEKLFGGLLTGLVDKVTVQVQNRVRSDFFRRRNIGTDHDHTLSLGFTARTATRGGTRTTSCGRARIRAGWWRTGVLSERAQRNGNSRATDQGHETHFGLRKQVSFHHFSIWFFG